METATFVHLFCRRGSLAGKSLSYINPAPLPMPDPLRIGRHSDSHFCCRGHDETLVSRFHAELQNEGEAIRLVDCDSSQGLFLARTQERISSMLIPRGAQVELQLGPSGPLCTLSVGLAVPFSHYWLTAKLGEGGMGEAYVAWDTRLERFVVLKLIHAALRDSATATDQHLFDEARIVSQLENQNVVRIYDMGYVGRVPYIAMEYLRGLSVNQISRWLQRNRTALPPEVAAGIMRQVCLGLHAAHELPTAVVHRDISSNNIMLTRESVKVIDFGLARATNRVSRSFTEEGRIAGCPPYMSPEQILEPKTIDRRSDIFSTATVLYELCSGHALFHRDNAMATMAAVCDYEPAPLRTICPSASPELEQLLKHALNKDPDARLATAAEFAIALRSAAGAQFCAHENIVEYLENSGFDLHGAPPSPLHDEPELVRQARTQMQADASVSVLASNSTQLNPIELAGRIIADGRYRLLQPIDAGPQLPARRWKRHCLAEQTADGSRLVIALCGGNLHDGAPSERDSASFFHYVARRCQGDAIPGLPPILDHGAAWTGGPCFLAIPYYPYRLSDLLSGGLPTSQDALRIAGQLARTLMQITQRESDFVHGKIAPQNIALQQSARESRQAILLNFSLRNVLRRNLEIETADVQSPWVAPEQLQQAEVTPAADVFSLALLLYRMLGGDVGAATREIGEQGLPPPLPAQAQAVLGASVQGALFDALRASPAMRPSAKDLHDLLMRDAEPPALMTRNTNGANVIALAGIEKGSATPLSSPTIGKLYVTRLELDGLSQREPLALPLDLSVLLAGCSHPIQVALANRLVELRVAPDALNAGRKVRIYPSVLESGNARSSYAIPETCAVQRLFIGHHREAPQLITVASNTQSRDGEIPSLSLPELGVQLQGPKGPRRMVAIYRTEPQRSLGQLVCISV